eukprot:scaffold91765_cov50-Prasinocladus_malaysianus.AAC.1
MPWGSCCTSCCAGSSHSAGLTSTRWRTSRPPSKVCLEPHSMSQSPAKIFWLGCWTLTRRTASLPRRCCHIPGSRWMWTAVRMRRRLKQTAHQRQADSWQRS